MLGRYIVFGAEICSKDGAALVIVGLPTSVGSGKVGGAPSVCIYFNPCCCPLLLHREMLK